MSEVQNSPTRFDVIILENGNELAQLLPHTSEHQEKIIEYLGKIYEVDPTFAQETNRKILGLFNTSLIELLKVINVVKDKIIDVHYNMGLSDKCKIVVAYDTTNKLPQAMGLVLLDRPDLKGGKCIELLSLITSVWNLNCPQNCEHPNRVKGAGSAIVEFCKKFGKEHQAKHLYLAATPGTLSFYEAKGFTKVCSEGTENNAENNFLSQKRVPMSFDLEAAKVKELES